MHELPRCRRNDGMVVERKYRTRQHRPGRSARRQDFAFVLQDIQTDAYTSEENGTVP